MKSLGNQVIGNKVTGWSNQLIYTIYFRIMIGFRITCVVIIVWRSISNHKSKIGNQTSDIRHRTSKNRGGR